MNWYRIQQAATAAAHTVSRILFTATVTTATRDGRIHRCDKGMQQMSVLRSLAQTKLRVKAVTSPEELK